MNNNMMTQREWNRVVGWGTVPEENDLAFNESQFFRRHDDPPKRRALDVDSLIPTGSLYTVDTSRRRFDD